MLSKHNLNLSGGTSGSPIFDLTGKVIAINNAGIGRLAFSLTGELVQVSQAALDFGIRVDKIYDLFQSSASAKPIANTDSTLPAPLLEGKQWETLDISFQPENLEERLLKAMEF